MFIAGASDHVGSAPSFLGTQEGHVGLSALAPWPSHLLTWVPSSMFIEVSTLDLSHARILHSRKQKGPRDLKTVMLTVCMTVLISRLVDIRGAMVRRK